MRYLSQIFQPLITIPKNAKVKSTEITSKSQKLLVECGLIRPTSPGLFAILPLARRALDKLEAHIRRGIESTGANRISLPTLTSAALWQRSGRLTGSPELMTLADRHQHKYLLAPTHEEAIADLIADISPISYKQLPLLLYQISNKYRDEHRPKHGLLRAREFSMMDLYGVHATMECVTSTYARVTKAYEEIFGALDVTVYRVQAPTGEMGGSASHEWLAPCAAGEDAVSVCPACRRAQLPNHNDNQTCDVCHCEMKIENSIEIGHTFVLGDRYSTPLNAKVLNHDGGIKPVLMSCYGIGVTRTMAACVDVLSTNECMRWPSNIAPFSALVIGPKEGSKEWSSHGLESIEAVYDRISSIAGLEGDVLIDDRHSMTIGKRLLMANRFGYPHIIVCGKAALQNPPLYEFYTTQKNEDKCEPTLMSMDEIVARLENRPVTFSLHSRS